MGRGLRRVGGIDFARNLSVVALTNTAFEGMIGQFTRDIAAAAIEGPLP